MFVVAYNPTDGPVLIDDAGRVVGGGEWAPVDSTDETAKAAFDAGRLLRAEAPARDANPLAVQAAAQAKAFTDRSRAFAALDRDDLAELARTAELIEGDQLPHKDELVAVLVRSDVPTPTPAKGK